MTKMISMRLRVPAGDDVTTEELGNAVCQVLEQLKVVQGSADGKDKRIHWSAIEMVRLIERAPAAGTPAKRPPRVPIVDQGVLA